MGVQLEVVVNWSLSDWVSVGLVSAGRASVFGVIADADTDVVKPTPPSYRLMHFMVFRGQELP